MSSEKDRKKKKKPSRQSPCAENTPVKHTKIRFVCVRPPHREMMADSAAKPLMPPRCLSEIELPAEVSQTLLKDSRADVKRLIL